MKIKELVLTVSSQPSLKHPIKTRHNLILTNDYFYSYSHSGHKSINFFPNVLLTVYKRDQDPYFSDLDLKRSKIPAFKFEVLILFFPPASIEFRATNNGRSQPNSIAERWAWYSHPNNPEFGFLGDVEAIFSAIPSYHRSRWRPFKNHQGPRRLWLWAL